MQQLQAANVTDPKQINDVLLQIEQANGSPVMQGVRLDVLRHNLVIADKMKTIAEGLQADTLSAANTSPGGSRTISVQARLDQLELLRKQLRMDIVVTPTAPLPVPPAPLAQSRLQ
ncbi:MAG: hypothetical protein EOO28_29680 [Comamonadaceae bacterium]|nr:MAG: hypothetical protein EOO28_29680 [Comamonadaceae bacterium]